ncbi:MULTISPECIES: sulfite exporter TauE/SafE family protein [Nocardiopsis]|uniref:Probable membrane transporter protein n=2 Tax=Nocardiopsis alba TaxID=53437 RepID=A0A7K2IS58_9ACTN|nr:MULTISPECIES: sulfite exporter TauE/SafE family protein [Nocardiopsis]AFR08806.1 sulfite exporter TauE/SafE family protein [Nocardiopsis alba ATCC BAA-2165]MEC3895258.1 sulfite exporter TauE/SafE family protein [Nocardiopsis sp. LDBS1602]MYR32771.1 TSUP family transporter [Nocardiopsis alba]
MELWEAAAILLAGIAAGGINAIAGSGTLFTFPVLLALGYPPITATVSNSIGLAPGSLSGTIAYRRELVGQRSRLIRFGGMSFIGAITGAMLLIYLPPGVFEAVVPFMIGAACVLIVLQPRITRWARSRRPASKDGGPWMPVGAYVTGTYGGYFAAAQGILLISLLGATLDEDLQRLNALKNALTTIANSTAAVFYIVLASPAWAVVGLIMAGTIIGGYLGAHFGRRLSPTALRVCLVLVGLTAAIQLLMGRV